MMDQNNYGLFGIFFFYGPIFLVHNFSKDGISLDGWPSEDTSENNNMPTKALRKAGEGGKSMGGNIRGWGGLPHCGGEREGGCGCMKTF